MTVKLMILFRKTGREWSIRFAKAFFVLAAAGCSHVVASNIKTVNIRVPEGHDEITYDADRVSLGDLKHWLTLSPVLSQNSDLLVPENVLSCYSQDAAYTNCGPRWSIWLNISNAMHTQEKIKDRLNRLNHEEFPPDFRPIVDYFRAVQSFGLWLNREEIEFFQTKNVSLLEKKYPALNLNPGSSCSSELDAVRKSTDEISEWKLVVFQWHNCMWKQFTAARGSYPQAVWDEALKSRGIRERLVVEEE